MPFIPPDKQLCFELISEYKCWKIYLDANKYQNSLYVWLKLYGQDKEKPELFTPRTGGVILPVEKLADVSKFINMCLTIGKLL
jgi:hypothetical protein